MRLPFLERITYVTESLWIVLLLGGPALFVGVCFWLVLEWKNWMGMEGVEDGEKLLEHMD